MLARRVAWAAICIVALLGTLIAADAAGAPPVLDVSPGAIAVWQTSPAGDRLTRLRDIPFTSASGVLPSLGLRVDPARTFQRIAGFGGAFNERGWLALQSVSADQRAAVMRALFDPRTGAGFSLARMPIGASDYALNAYSLDDWPGDILMSHFSIDRDQELLIPFIRAARAVAPDLTLWASPWSAPAWMKTNQSMIHGGSLVDTDMAAYARYFAAYLQAYAAAGLNVSAVSVQNEPSQATVYPSMVMPPAQMATFVADYLAPLLAALRLQTAIRVNEEPSRASWGYTIGVLANQQARAVITGSNLHGYHGVPRDLLLLHRAAPRLDIWQTEDTHLDGPHVEYDDVARWGATIAADLQNWVSGWEYWNMVTDQTGQSSWGWRQDAVVLVNTHTHSVRLTPKYFAMAHFSRFIRPGAVRISTSGVPRGLIATAARNADGSKVLVVINSGSKDTTFRLEVGSSEAAARVPARGMVTLVWS